ncbi:MAG: hypothetical protein HY316_04000 [Acidobacteria bacterium]|nr:hypothetical protein [Acidobacteriota bacterium]
MRLSQVHTELGNVLETGYGCHTYISPNPTRTTRIEDRVNFETGEAWESFDWRFEGEELRLLAYAVETGFEDGTPDWEMALAPLGVRPNATTCAAEDLQTMWWEEKR